jgi:hypothetical protein
MGLANNAMTDAQRLELSQRPDSEEYRLRVGGSKTQVLGWSLYTTLLWLLKACMAVFYSRLTCVTPPPKNPTFQPRPYGRGRGGGGPRL